MSHRTISAFGVFVLIVALGTPVRGLDKEQRQMMADIRMLQEQNQVLQNQLASLLTAMTDALKAINTRLDDQTNATRKGLADQKLLIDNLSNDVRVIRERLDDNTVRLGSLTQEVDALRQGVQQLNSRPTFSDLAPVVPGGTPDPGSAGAVPPPAAPQATPAAPIGVSPQRLWDAAFSDFSLAQYDLAIQGFESFIRSFPRDDRSDDAQVYIGNAYLLSARNDKAVEAYDIATRTYPAGNALPEAYYKKGLALQNLRQLDRAKEAWEFVVKTYPESAAAGLASQRLAQIARTAPPAPTTRR